MKRKLFGSGLGEKQNTSDLNKIKCISMENLLSLELSCSV